MLSRTICAVLFFALSALVVGKNFGPPPLIRDEVTKPAASGRSAENNRAPGVRMTGHMSHHAPAGHRRDNEGTSNDLTDRDMLSHVPETHIFYRNFQINYSWTDERLLQALGARPKRGEEAASSKLLLDKRGSGGHALGKRSPPGGSPGNPIFKVSACLGCLQAQQGVVTSLDDLSTEYLEQQILLTDQQMLDRCVFYTSVPSWEEDRKERLKRRELGGEGQHTGLSKIATDWACRNNKVTIWVSSPIHCQGDGLTDRLPTTH
ncbi:hypothetical protein PG997_001812 [Apiospora hydei]|uniref:Uncharacterized protein n=1 Tax=Apiospora hydei TaxID=1337664 RepID=A0ABR1X7K9_9PEZI